MGLDITAYGKMEFVEPFAGDDSDLGYEGPTVGWPGIRHRIGDMRPGRYRNVGGVQFQFRAGSYSGYNRWRAALCRFALGVDPDDVWRSPASFAGKPFVELIDFSDAEGEIAGAAATKLAEDFRTHRDAAAKWGERTDDEWFIRSYDEWAKGFAMAADGGVVSFH